MADTEQPDDGPSLEMPSFSLRRRRAAAAGPTPDPVTEPAPEPALLEPDPTPEPEPEPVRRSRAVVLPGASAALLVGVAVGLAAVVLGWALGAGCEAVRGTSACGGAIGLPALLASLVLLAWLGALGLRLLGVGDAGSTSALAVGIAAVVVLVALLDALDHWWAAVALPVLGAVAYAVAWWVTAVLASSDGQARAPQPHDVR
ncbi:hypothetical protein KDN32_19470 [Nocardioides sp. J2M5]|uniref:hypothetical protein n=1 Tax=Nocardioides palaemonis TaxID=2829810 RepID=UPI001BA702D9|nr:hypothetical protein [Nocardioides palaemonis]MBS2939926.1 hypothetical protein [Nocardioides palaemonis]